MSKILQQMQYDIEQLKSKVDNMIRPATVTKVYDDAIGFVDVVSGEIKLDKIPVYTAHNEEDVVQWLPTVGEDGTIFSAGGDLANAFFTSTIPTKKQNIEKVGDGNPLKTIGIKLRDDSTVRIEHGKNTIDMDEEKINIKHGVHEIEINDNQIILKSPSKIEQRISPTHYKELTTIVANIIGAHFFNTGFTSLTCAVGAIMFPPAPSPGVAPALPAGSSLEEGKATKLPAQRTNNVKVLPGSDISQVWSLENMSLVVTTPIPVVTPAGPGTIAAGTYPIQLTGNLSTPITGTLNLEFPAKDL